jgi:hypothetical protein
MSDRPERICRHSWRAVGPRQVTSVSMNLEPVQDIRFRAVCEFCGAEYEPATKPR